jgi:hypothetical protein
VSSGALVAALGNSYSVPIEHVGAPVTVRIHRERIVIWRDAELLAEHARAPDGAHHRVVNPAHFAPLFGRKPRGQAWSTAKTRPPRSDRNASSLAMRRDHIRRDSDEPRVGVALTADVRGDSCWRVPIERRRIALGAPN